MHVYIATLGRHGDLKSCLTVVCDPRSTQYITGICDVSVGTSSSCKNLARDIGKLIDQVLIA